MTVVKVKGGWKVRSSTKGFLSKRPLTQAKAKAQHRAVQISKARKAGHRIPKKK